MKLRGYLALDLADTQHLPAPPTGAFKRWIGRLTGTLAQDVEREVLPMAGLLGALHEALAVRRHDNLVRLAVDDVTVYDDLTGVPGDLALALNAATPEALADADRLQLVVEEEDDDPALYTVLNCHVYRRHAPGAFPVWVRATALSKDLLRREGEKPKPYQERIAALTRDTARFVQASEAARARLEQLLTALRDELATRLTLAGSRVGAHVSLALGADDYFLSLRPEYWDAAQLLAHHTAGMILPEALEAPAPLAALAKEQHGKIAALERKLAKTAVESPENRSWRAYARRRVVNPRTGKVCQIGSLPTDLQRRYRALFNGGAAAEQHVVEPGLMSRMLGRAKRGAAGEVRNEIERMRKRAPWTYAFLANRKYRAKVMTHGAKLLGQEMIDLADTIAVTAVRELYETGRIPIGWFKAKKPVLRQKDHQAIANTQEQMVDIVELIVGTLIPVGGFTMGGPLGGAMALAGVKMFQKALNWHSKRNGGREWTILPSAWHARRTAIEARRAPAREQADGVLEREAARIVADDRLEQKAEMIALQRQLAEDFRDFGRQLVAGEVEIDDELLDVSTLKDTDIKAALLAEADASTGEPATDAPGPDADGPLGGNATTGDGATPAPGGER